MLDNMAEEENTCESQDAHVEGSGLPKVTLCCPWADSLSGQIDKLSRDLMALRDQLHKLVTHRKAAWCEKWHLTRLFFPVTSSPQTSAVLSGPGEPAPQS